MLSWLTRQNAISLSREGFRAYWTLLVRSNRSSNSLKFITVRNCEYGCSIGRIWLREPVLNHINDLPEPTRYSVYKNTNCFSFATPNKTRDVHRCEPTLATRARARYCSRFPHPVADRAAVLRPAVCGGEESMQRSRDGPRSNGGGGCRAANGRIPAAARSGGATSATYVQRPQPRRRGPAVHHFEMSSPAVRYQRRHE